MTDSTSSTVEPVLAGATTALFLVAFLHQGADVLPSNSYEIPEGISDALRDSSILDNSSVSTYDLVRKAEILNRFYAKLALQSEDLRPEAVEAINNNFWNLF